MSQENVEVMRRLVDAFAAGDAPRAWAAALEVIDPEMEMDMTRVPLPGLARVYNGVEQVAKFWREWLEAWGSLGVVEGFEHREAGDQIVWWSTRQTMQGKGSGLEIDMPEYAWTATIRDRKIVRATWFGSKKDALEAAGLSE